MDLWEGVKANEKEKGKEDKLDIPQLSIEQAEKCLIDNGIDRNEASTVLQALGYALLDTELYPNSGEKVCCLGKVQDEQIARAEQCLIDNGIDRDEASIVLQALGYILMDEELYPEPDEKN